MSTAPTRWYYLRHPDDFDDGMFSCFEASCSLWQAEIEGLERVWTSLPIYQGFPPPSYEFGRPQRGELPCTVVLPVGGDTPYGVMKLFEDSFPETLHSHFPVAFAVQLEKGRRDTLGLFPEIEWLPVHPQLASGPRRLILNALRRLEAHFDPYQMSPRRLRRLMNKGGIRRPQSS